MISEDNPVTNAELPQICHEWWIQQARDHLGGSEAEVLEALRPAVQKLSDLFTTQRPETYGDYSMSDEARLAYGLFYLPRNHFRIHCAIAEALHLHQWAPPETLLRVLDLGAGLGAASLAAARLFPHGCAITAVDHSGPSLDTLRAFIQASCPQATVQTERTDLRRWQPTGQGYDLIIAGFALNELPLPDSFALLEKLRPCLAPGGLLVIVEPAMPEAVARLDEWGRQQATESQWQLWGPWPRMAQAYAAHPEAWWDGLSFPHEVRRWQPPEHVEYLNRKLHRNLREAKFAFVLASNQPPPQSPALQETLARLASPLHPLKGRLIAALECGDGHRRTLELSTRNVRKHDRKLIEKRFERGDLVAVSEPERREENRLWRIAEVGQLTHAQP